MSLRVILVIVTLIVLAHAGSDVASVDFTVTKVPSSWQAAPGSDATNPFYFGNHILFQNVHINGGENNAFPDEDPREAGDKYWVRFISDNSMFSFSPADLIFSNDNSSTTPNFFNITGSYDVTVYAQNPSATGWYAPGAPSFDADYASTPTPPAVAAHSDVWRAKVACINTTGGDCFAQYCVNNPTAEQAFGFCWQDIFVGSPSANTKAYYVETRRLFLYDAASDTLAISDGQWDSLSVSAYPNLPSQSYVLGLPLAANPPSSPSAAERPHFPGLDNNGGTITVDVWEAFVFYNNGTAYPMQNLPIEWSGQTLSLQQPTTTFRLTSVPGGAEVSSLLIFFRVTNEQFPSVITPSNSTQNSTNGVYGSGAYSIPYLSIDLKQIAIQFQNFPPGAGGSVAIPISPAPPSEGYVLTIDFTPAALGVQSISLPFNVTPTGAITFYVNGTAVDPAVGFTFFENSRVIVFGVATQTTPLNAVSLTFGTPIVIGGTVSGLSLPSNLLFAVSGAAVGPSPGVSVPGSTTAAPSGSTAAPSGSNGGTTAASGSTDTIGSTQAPNSPASVTDLAFACILLAITVILA